MGPLYGLLLIVALAGYACLSQPSRFDKVHAYADRMCPHDQIEFQTVTASAVSCVATCAEKPGCRSLLYLQGNKTCYGVRTDYPFAAASSPLPEATFYKDASKAYYGEECSTTRVCVEHRTTCFAGLDRCVCDPYTSNYNEATKTCTPGCESYSGEYQHYPLIALWYHDAESHTDQYNVTACLQYCSQITTFTCHSTDYQFADKSCSYNSIHVSGAPGDLRAEGYADVYIRNCIN